jgi:peptidoglycan hydrolase-like protein with peptidoglycan-binding domain
MATPKERQRMAVAIMNFEARRENGHLAVHKLPDIDRGGSYEVAGINEKNNKETADVLVALIDEERYAEAEALAIDFIAQDTDRASSWSGVPALEFYLRDCLFNRGARGAARILQRALGAEDDGVVGAQTRAAISAAESDPAEFLSKLREAREQYERDVAKRDETSPFWRGLVNRWNKACEIARTFPIVASVELEPQPGPPISLAPPSPVPVPPNPVSAPPQFDSSAPATLSALRVGMRGDRVLAWQTFLVGKGFDNGPIDGFFGEHTRDATKEFQKKCKLEDDGVAGRTTLLKAAALGFELIEEPAEDNTSSNFPPRPSFPPLVRDDQRAAVFSRFEYVSAPTPDNPEAIRILGNWEKENIITVPIPQLSKTSASKPPQAMRFHRLAAKQLQGLWEEWESAKLLNRIVSYDGSYVPRFIRGSRTALSNHAFGTAFDINFKYNGLGRRPALVGETGCVRELVRIAHQWGFYWGGHFTRLDGMHFEVAFLKR